MADEVETTAQAPIETPAPVTATTQAPDVDGLVKAAVEKAQREAQAAKDRELARTHQQYQQQIRAEREAAVGRLKQHGDQGADQWASEVDVLKDAQEMRRVREEAGRMQAWNTYAASVATAYGLDPADKRLANPADYNELIELAKKAMAEDAEAERKKLLNEASAAKRDALDKKVQNGELDTLGGRPAGGGQTGDLRQQFNKELAALRGKGASSGTALRAKYREMGLNV